MLKVDKRTARRFLLDKQKLREHMNYRFTSSPTNVLEIIRTLECVQIDPVAVVGQNQHLVLNARIPGYKQEHLTDLLSEGKVFEYKANEASIIPIEDYPILEPIRERMRAGLQERVEALEPVVEHVLKRLQKEGALPSRAFKSDVKVHGYWDNKAPSTKETSLALNLLMDTGEIRVVGRVGTERYFGISELTVPQKILQQTNELTLEEARQGLIDKYIKAYRIFDAADPRFGWQRMKARDRREEIEQRVQKGILIPLEIEEVKRKYFILSEDVPVIQEIANESSVEMDPADGPIRFLPPLDSLLWRRERVLDFFDFFYKWEIYIPKEKREYGAYTMPILAGDRIIGRVDPRVDRENNQLVIQIIKLEPPIKKTPKLRKALRMALEHFATSLGVGEVIVEKPYKI